MRITMTLADTNKYNKMYDKAMINEHPIVELTELSDHIALMYTDKCKEAKAFINGIADTIKELKNERRV